VASIDPPFSKNLKWAAAIAKNVWRKLPPCFDLQDLQQEARIKLWKCCQAFDPNNLDGVPFKGFAYIYIRGACLMSVRRRHWTEATHESLTGDGLLPQVLDQGSGDGRERWSIGKKVARSGRDAVDQRNNPEQELLISTEAEQANQAQRERMIRLFSAIPAPVPPGIVLVRIICVEGEGIEALARKRGVSTKDLVRKLNSGVRQLRKLQNDGVLKEISGFPVLGPAHVN
jgi:RNA polymerase sigma factor (sigma-70 family)